MKIRLELEGKNEGSLSYRGPDSAELAVTYLSRNDLAHISPESEMRTSPIDSISKLDNEADFEDEEIYSERIIDEPVVKPQPGNSEKQQVTQTITSVQQESGISEKKPVIGLVNEHERIREAKMKGYTGDICQSCGSSTMVRNGTCLKCTTCGDTSGCS